MDGFQVLRARRAAHVSQWKLAKALRLCQRGTLTDVESGAVEVTEGWAYKALAKIQAIREEEDAALPEQAPV